MEQTIRIQKSIIGNEKIESVDARELWMRLEVETPFHKWIKRRLEELKLVEGIDFTSTDKIVQREIGGTVRNEYILSLDASKHIALMEGNEQGKAIRQYFINFEKYARKQAEAFLKYENHPAVIHMKEVFNLTIKYVELEEEQQKLAKLQEQNQREIKEVESKAKAVLGQSGFYSVLAYANMVGMKIDLNHAAKLGKEATVISKKYGVEIGNIPDPRYGRVNTYHEDILRNIFGNGNN